MEATLPFYYSDYSMQKAFNFFLDEKVTKNQALHENWLKISSPAHAKKLGTTDSAKQVLLVGLKQFLHLLPGFRKFS